ncbi:hypothetical protein G3578_05700 [Brevibacillus sp. SYP-B805]|uniref:hypothetical protein n=1 Tax=Brevibacillus sp. SYP-B805 TaxID=1578199 RepID=UPI0013EAAA53|nr:hypothetical protein [Brevibacillus sp. SYP-B805]NGQ94675.1 hypothetical protein [Brevibacillus sp. SYP-B805]
MKKRNPWLPVLFALALVIAQFSHLPAAQAISKMKASADDDTAGKETSYTIEFRLDEDFDDGDHIYIEFDDDFEIDEDLDTDDVEVDGDEPDDVYVDDNVIEIEVGEDYDEDDTIEVTIDGITNPDDEGSYRIWVETDNDDDRDYDTVKIREDDDDAEENVFTVTPTSPVEGDQAGYIFSSFDLKSRSDDLESGEDVEITFPSSSMLPDERDVDTEDVTINGYDVSRIDIAKNRVILGVPRRADGDDFLKIEFFRGFGITNPKNGSNYTITVEYDGYEYESKAFAIQPAVVSKDFPVSLSSHKAGAHASYAFEASFGKDQIKAGRQLKVEFPSADMIPDSLSRFNITINGFQARNVSVSGSTVTLTASSRVPSSRVVKVVFTSAANLKNPTNPGTYQLKMTMSGIKITSRPFTITP